MNLKRKNLGNFLITKNKDYNIKYNSSENNEYNRYIITNKIFPQLELYQFFYVMTKQTIFGKCAICGSFENYGFETHIGFNLDYLIKIANFLNCWKR